MIKICVSYITMDDTVVQQWIVSTSPNPKGSLMQMSIQMICVVGKGIANEGPFCKRKMLLYAI